MTEKSQIMLDRFMLLAFGGLFGMAICNFNPPSEGPPYFRNYFMSYCGVVFTFFGFLSYLFINFCPIYTDKLVKYLKTEKNFTSMFVSGILIGIVGGSWSTILSLLSIPLDQRQDQTHIAFAVSIVGIILLISGALCAGETEPKAYLQIPINDKNMKNFTNLKVAEGKYDTNELINRMFTVYDKITRCSIAGRIFIHHNDGTIEEFDLNELPTK